ncbi:MAG TPA: N-acetylmuramoyl-L-alanine amidase CwlD, partial [Acholeplasmataceae bacterium]|nr:N-acetylmuramoyl-L-alanine amidase CwlD [Acholeplasmataceae bacterium]
MKKVFFIFIILLLASLFICVEAVMDSNKKSDIIIYLDPGHGGRDGGAIGVDGTYEKDITLSICFKLRDLFINSGFKVLMTREGDYDLAPTGSRNHKRDDIHKRVDMINKSNADFYISVHANSFPSSKVHGAQTFFKQNESLSRDLAVCIQNAILVNLLNTKRIAKHIKGIYLIDHVLKPGVLVEVGFLSNANDLSLLKDENYQLEMAMAIFLGTCEFLESNYQENY